MGRATERVIRDAGCSAVFVETDVTNATHVQRMVQVAVDTFGAKLRHRRVDILVNAAGVLRYGYTADLSEHDWDLTIAVNLKGTFLCCKAVLPLMKEQNDGVIVNISSSGARSCPPEYPAYVASKAAVLGLTRSIAREAYKHHVSIQAICPVMVDTPMGRQAFLEFEGRAPHAEELARMLKPESVAKIILHMVSPDMRDASSTVVDTME
jgi:3-oxoacyl-[acyl-carrier protein] reductase